MVLNAKDERVISQPDLLDHIVGRAPGFNLQALSDQIEGLMMRAVYFFKPMRGAFL